MKRSLVSLTGVGALLLTAVAASLPVASSPALMPTEPPQIREQRSERLQLDAREVARAIATGALDREVKTLLNIREKLRHGDYQWNDRGVPEGDVWIRVDLGAQLLSVFRAGHEIGTAVILFGAEDKETPTGVHSVQWRREKHHSSTYDAPMPYTLNLTDDGVAIHGSDVRWGRGTHGCIGVPLEFARRLFYEVRPGDEVAIVGHLSDH